jgi:methyl-accepting chemotaxis protein
MKLTVRQKLLLGGVLLMLLAVALTAVVLGKSAIDAGEAALTEEARNKLTSLRENKRQQIEDYFNTIVATTRGLAASYTFIEAMKAMQPAYHNLLKSETLSAEQQAVDRKRLLDYYTGDFVKEFAKRNPGAPPDMAAVLGKTDAVTQRLQSLYITANPNPLGEKNKLNFAADASAYTQLHAQFHPGIEEIRKQLGYYDVFLIDNDGRVIYTAFKELDFATSLADGAAATTGLGDVWRRAKSLKKGEVAITDYAEYLISYNDQASFIGTPLFNGNDRIGTLAIQIPLDQITRVMTTDRKWSQVGLGASGETYLVGADGLMRTDSRFLLENKKGFVESLRGKLPEATVNAVDRRGTTIGLLKITTEGAKAGLTADGFGDFPDYRNEPVYSAYGPLKLPGLKWVVLAEIDKEEALKPARALAERIARIAIIGGLATLLLGAAAVFVFGTRFVKPIEKLSGTVKKIAEGDYAARARLDSGDEVGQLGRQFDALLDERIAQLAQSQAENDRLNESIVQLLEAVFRLSQRDLTVRVPVREDITGSLADAINALSTETAGVMTQVVDTANQVEGASGRVKARGDDVVMLASREREEVDRAAEALAAASAAMQQIAERAKLCNNAADRAIRATQSALGTVQNTVGGMESIRETIRETEKRMKRLSERSQEISTVVSLINSIAERTHVLAINANMQAAMAGEAGRGFAVVASEVQSLAENARQATAQISQLVNNIQIETADTIATMNNAVSQVVEGSKLARQAGEQMNETQAATSNLVELVGQIDHGAQQQARVSQDLVVRAVAIRESTQKTGAELSQQAEETKTLVAHAEALRQAVSVFTLPAR